MLKMNFQNLQYFITVARTLNFTQAAQELYISQPALSKQIRQMEEGLGVQLFIRSTKTVKLTPGGQLLYDYLSQMTQQLEMLVQEAKTLNRVPRAVKVGILEMGGVIEYTMPLLEAYAQMEADFDFHYEVYSFNQLRQKFAEGELDMIFTFSSEAPTERGCVTEVLRDLELNIIVSRNNPLSAHDDLTVPDLRDEEFCLLSSSFSDRAAEYILRHCKAEGFTPQKMRNYPNLTTLFLAISQGKGVTLGYRVFFNQFQNDLCKVRFYSIPEAIENHKVVMTYRRHNETGLQDLLTFLRAARQQSAI